MSNQERHISVWAECLRIIENNVDASQFETWFKPIKSLELNGSTLLIEVPSDFFRERLEDVYLDLLKKTLFRVIGPEAKLVYSIRPIRSENPMVYPANLVATPKNDSVSIGTWHPANAANPFVIPGIQRVKIDPRLKSEYCFANMIAGECNKMGITAGESIAQAPGKTPFNPLFIFGRSGLGKTHLAQAIGISIKEKYPELVVLYVTGNEFKNQYVDAVMGNKVNEFFSFYMKIDVLIMDDIQDLQGPASQNAFFNIFSYIHQNGHQLIFTSDRSPAELKNFEERLLSRFKWGLSVELRTPDYETRLTMLRARCFREGVKVNDNVLEYLATRIKTNFRELEGALISVIAQSTLLKKEITIDMAGDITDKLVGEAHSDISIDKIQRVVCDYFQITREDLLSKTRKHNIALARQIAMYVSRNHLENCSLSTIGQELGGKDHATVVHACKTVSDLILTDKSTRKYVKDIESILVPVNA